MIATYSPYTQAKQIFHSLQTKESFQLNKILQKIMPQVNPTIDELQNTIAKCEANKKAINETAEYSEKDQKNLHTYYNNLIAHNQAIKKRLYPSLPIEEISNIEVNEPIEILNPS